MFVIRDVLEVERAPVFRILVVIYITSRDYWEFELYPSSGILNNTQEHNVSETGPVSVLR
jgi:hypothetical protein